MSTVYCCFFTLTGAGAAAACRARKKEAGHAVELLPVKRTEKKYKIFPASS